jgi:hypothetical protein
MPKNDFIIHDGSLTVKVGKRISYNDKEFGETSRERTRNISKYFKNKLLILRDEIENENYFKDILYSNYIYKEEKIQKNIRLDFDKNKGIYHVINDKLPMNSSILHIADDYGQLDILLISKYIDRKITTFIDDQTKASVAKNCYTGLRRKVSYVPDIKIAETQKFDSLLLTSSRSAEILDSFDLTNFEQIVCLNQDRISSRIIEVGFEISYTDEYIVCFKS